MISVCSNAIMPQFLDFHCTHTHTWNLEAAHAVKQHDSSDLYETQVQMAMSYYPSWSQKCLCLVRSPRLIKLRPHEHINPLSEGWLTAEHTFFCLDLDTTTTPLLQTLNHSFPSWQTSYHLPPTTIASTSDFATSLHLLLIPRHGLVFFSSPNKTCLGSLASYIRPTWPDHLRSCSRIMLSIDFWKPKSFTSCLAIWSLVTPNIALTHGLWKRFNFIASLAFSA